jgi:signal peptidase II
MSKLARWFGLSAAVIAADLVTKWAVLAAFAPGERRAVTGFFNLVLAFNKGAAFSLLADAPGWQGPVLIAFALIAGAVVSVLMLRPGGRSIYYAGLALILGGALGNLVDRLRFGHVVDFLDFHAFGWHWPAFNVADSAICIGAALLILDGLRPQGRRAVA